MVNNVEEQTFLMNMSELSQTIIHAGFNLNSPVTKKKNTSENDLGW